MKYYDTSKLSIGSVGIVTSANNKKSLHPTDIVIVKQKNSEQDFYYFDIFSDKKYIEFYSSFCVSGNNAIANTRSLSLFVTELCNGVSLLLELEIIKNIVNGRSVSEEDLKKFYYALNTSSKTNKNLYELLSDEKSNNNKKSIKFNFITPLTNKKYKLERAHKRDEELNKLISILAEKKKIPILIGKRGVGKTSIVNELANKIKNKKVPDFLKKYKIIELELPKLFIDSKTIETKIIKLIESINNDNTILFIDEINNIENNNFNILKLLKFEAEKRNLKIIGTINSDSNTKSLEDDLFVKIEINEPDNQSLYEIVYGTFNKYSKDLNIKLPHNLNKLINILIEFTKIENRILKNENSSNKTYNYDIYNPGLIIEIIDKIFAEAKIQDSKEILTQNILCAIKSCDKINDEAKKETLKDLETYHTNTIDRDKDKILVINHEMYL